MSWHLDGATAEAYTAGTLDLARAASLEAHVLRCGDCRALIASNEDHDRLERVWVGIVDGIDAPAPRPLERLLRALGVRDHTARLIAATPSLQVSWFAAISIAIAFAVLAAQGNARGAIAFLVLAPLIPLAGVAVAYGPGVDPTYEVGTSAPIRGSYLLLVRASTVLTTTFAVLGAASVAIPGLGWKAAAWVVPALAVSVVALALSTWLEPLWAGGVTGVAWLAIALGSARGRRGLPVAERIGAFTAEGQVAFVVVVVVAAAVLLVRARTLDAGRDR